MEDLDFVNRTNGRCGSAAEEPMVRGLTAGAEWIRTFSSALDRQRFRGSSELGPIYLRIGHPSPRRHRRTDRVVGRQSEEPPLTARMRRHHTTATLSAVRAHRGTEGSNPLPSTGESGELPITSEGPARF